MELLCAETAVAFVLLLFVAFVEVEFVEFDVLFAVIFAPADPEKVIGGMVSSEALAGVTMVAFATVLLTARWVGALDMDRPRASPRRRRRVKNLIILFRVLFNK